MSFSERGEEELDVGDDTYLVTRPVNGSRGSILSVAERLNMIDQVRRSDVIQVNVCQAGFFKEFNVC